MNQNTDMPISAGWIHSLDPPLSYIKQEKRTIKGKTTMVDVTVDLWIIAATGCGKVLKTRWLPPSETEKRPRGRWEFLGSKSKPIAWMPWPSHPSPTRKDEAR